MIFSVCSIVIIFIFLLTLYLNIVVLNKAFYISSLSKSGVYENLTRGVKGAVTNILLNQVSSQEDYENMTVGERQEIDIQINEYVTFINEENMRDFLEGNINYTVSYLNGNSNIWYIYLPINEWGLPAETFRQIPDYLKLNKVDIMEILRNQNGSNSNYPAIVKALNNISKYTMIIFILSLVFLITIYFLYGSINPKENRLQSVGKLFTFQGLFILIGSWILFTAYTIFSEGSLYKTQWSEILAGILVPIFIKPLVFVFAFIGIIMLITGIILFNKKIKSNTQ